MGAKLALDDFGTGYSPLGYLTALPIDTLKIDQTFISSLSADPASQAIATAIIQLAHGLGMTVVAEGVETAEQHHVLKTLGSDACHGYYFARPMPHAKLDSFFRNAHQNPLRLSDTRRGTVAAQAASAS